MLKISYPAHIFRTKQQQDKEFIFDEVRRKWVILTPEEWVRQHFIQYLVQVRQYPASLMAVEKTIILNTLKKRCDIVLYKNQQPWMIVECKEAATPLSATVMQQVIQYNMAIPAQYLVITNGPETRGFTIHENNFIEFTEWPSFR